MAISYLRNKYGEWCRIVHVSTKHSTIPDLDAYAHMDFIWVVYVPVNVDTIIAVYESDAEGKVGPIIFGIGAATKGGKKVYAIICKIGGDMWVANSGIAANIDEIIKRWTETTEGGLPDTIERVLETLPPEQLQAYLEGKCHPRFEYVQTKLTNEVLRRTRARFGIGCMKDPEMDCSEWLLVEIDCKTGSSIEYP